MVKLFEIGIIYTGDFEESDYCVFENKNDALEFTQRQALKIMITTVSEQNLKTLETICKKSFNKTAEEITTEDIDEVDDKKREQLFKELIKIQDKTTGVKDFFAEEVEYFTDSKDNKYMITLKK